MTEHSRESVRKFVVDCRAEESLQRKFSPLEHKLWDMAEEARYGTRVITTNEQVLADPYLMRVYLTPEREQLELQLTQLGVPPAYSKYIQYMPRPYLHYFFRGDDDRSYHNHPWKRSLSLILIGGYVEHIWNFELKQPLSRQLKPGQVNYLKRGTYHRVELLTGKKCWTLFTSSGRVQTSDGQDWEFYDPETGIFTPWGDWTAEMARPRKFYDYLPPGMNFQKEAELGRLEFTPIKERVPPLVERADDPDAGHGGYNWSAMSHRRR